MTHAAANDLPYNDKAFYVEIRDITSRYSATQRITQNTRATEREKFQFKVECKDMLINILDTMFEISPLKYPLVRNYNMEAVELNSKEASKKREATDKLSEMQNKKKRLKSDMT